MWHFWRGSGVVCLAAMLGLGGLGPGLARAELPPPVRQAMRQAQLPPSALSVLVTPVSEAPPRARLAHRESEPMKPASVMKLFTTYAGLQVLGPEHGWGPRGDAGGPVQRGVLQA